MARVVGIDKLGAEIERILQEYNEEVTQDVIDATKEVVKSGVRAIKQESRSKFGGKGKYANSWTSDVESGRLSAQGAIYNRMAGLPHLLEHGHANLAFGRSHPDKPYVSGKAHVSLVQDMVDRDFTQILERKIRG